MTLVSRQEQSFRVKSYVKRDARSTKGQQRAYQEWWAHYGLPFEPLNSRGVFGHDAPLFLEIGFGSGHSLFALAKDHSDKHFIGVETHKPGIGALLQTIHDHQLKNLRLYHGDVIDVLMKCIPNESLTGVQIFFPDPWPKRRHHPRRLIQPEFVQLVLDKLIAGGELHLATDWEDYAVQMMRVVSQNKSLLNLAGDDQYAARSSSRPILTKFERRALREGRLVRELQFRKCS